MATAQNSLLFSRSRNTRTFLTVYLVFVLIFQDIFLSAGVGSQEYDEESVEGGGGVGTTPVNLQQIENSTFPAINTTFEDSSSSTVRSDPFNKTMQSPGIGTVTVPAEYATTPRPINAPYRCPSASGSENNPYSMGISINLFLLIAQYFMLHCF